MFRRSPRSTSPLRRRQEEIARQEAELREKLAKLERMVANGPRSAEDTFPSPREEPRKRDRTGDTQLHVSVALQRTTGGPDDFSPSRDRARGSDHLANEPSALLIDNHGENFRP